MPNEYRIMSYIAVAVAGVVYGVLQFPPLTTPGPAGTRAINQVKYEAVYDAELDHCEEQPESYDCRCFARISGVVQAGEEIKIRGAVHADRQELARMQAAGSC